MVTWMRVSVTFTRVFSILFIIVFIALVIFSKNNEILGLLICSSLQNLTVPSILISNILFTALFTNLLNLPSSFIKLRSLTYYLILF